MHAHACTVIEIIGTLSQKTSGSSLAPVLSLHFSKFSCLFCTSLQTDCSLFPKTLNPWVLLISAGGVLALWHGWSVWNKYPLKMFGTFQSHVCCAHIPLSQLLLSVAFCSRRSMWMPLPIFVSLFKGRKVYKVKNWILQLMCFWFIMWKGKNVICCLYSALAILYLLH